ncbi:MAG: hypothetical protein IJI41_06835 [Anaerolineaceae bacterium]|nr:hypothetical protein [Anaerolineaceae bacterium]
MEIKSFEYKLKYGPLELLLDILPPGSAVFLNMKIADWGFRQMNQECEPAWRLGCSMLISAGLVFGLVFLYEIIEQLVTGSSRKVRIDRCGSSFLIRFGCRSHYFRRSDIKAFDFDTEKRKLTVILTRCLEKRRGIYSYMRLFIGTKKTFSESAADYLAPLVAGGPDLLRFGEPDSKPGCFFSPFAWTPVTRIQMIEHEGIFEFSIPCPSGSLASEIISGFIGDRNLGTVLEGL